jgi:hypothetical protein
VAHKKNADTLARLYARPGFLLRRAHQISAAVFEDECRGLGLTQAQKPAEAAYKRLLAPLTGEQQGQLVELLQLLTGELEDDARAAFIPPGRVR